jgi:hypothetical protein
MKEREFRPDITHEEIDALNYLFPDGLPGYYISNAQTKEMLDKLPKSIDENGNEVWTWKLTGNNND